MSKSISTNGTRHSPEVRWTISAYALYIRDMMGDKDVAKTKKLLAEATIEKMPFEALAGCLVGARERSEFDRSRSTAIIASSDESHDRDGSDGEFRHRLRRRCVAHHVFEPPCRRRAARSDDQRPIRKERLSFQNSFAACSITATKGAWSNTQENVFILLALDKYFNAFEKVTPDFVTRIWLGNTYAGEEVFKGRSVDSKQLNIPMSYLVDQGGTSNLILDRQGAGRLVLPHRHEIRAEESETRTG